jgi:hypothetical protein
MIQKSTLYSNFLVSIAAKLLLFCCQWTKTQQNHLKAYGITFWCLEKNYKASWLLNYRGGSFLLPDAQTYGNVKLEALALIFRW